jgi:hypothetical protein
MVLGICALLLLATAAAFCELQRKQAAQEPRDAADRAKLEGQLASARASNASLTRSHQQQLDELRVQAEQELQEQRQQAAQLQVAVSTGRGDRVRLQQENKRLQQRVQAQETQLRNQRLRAQKLQAALAASRGEVALQQKAQRLQQRVQAQEAQVQLQATQQLFEQQAAALQQAAAAAAAEAKELQQRVQAQETQLRNQAAMLQELDAVRLRAQELQAALAASRGDNDGLQQERLEAHAGQQLSAQAAGTRARRGRRRRPLQANEPEAPASRCAGACPAARSAPLHCSQRYAAQTCQGRAATRA